MTLLSVTDLEVRTRADGRSVLRDMSFSIEDGQRLGLIGGSGSGKSVTSLAVLGLLPAGLEATGRIDLLGVPMIEASERAARSVRGSGASMVFQEPSTALDPLMRVGRQVAEPIRRSRGIRGAALRSAVADALAEVSLDDARITRAFPHELSGGQRQRIAIAIALASSPRLLIADEPTTALDVTVQAEVLALLDRLVRERGMALLFISHDLPVVASMVEDAIVLADGAEVERGLLSTMLAAPRHPSTAALVASARAVDDALEVRA
jgi:peptide/nickel transport system ATP-binding protein